MILWVDQMILWVDQLILFHVVYAGVMNGQMIWSDLTPGTPAWISARDGWLRSQFSFTRLLGLLGGWVPRRIPREWGPMCTCLSSFHLHHVCHGPTGQSYSHGQVQSQRDYTEACVQGSAVHRGPLKCQSTVESHLATSARASLGNMLKFVSACFSTAYLASITSENAHNNIMG